MIYKINKKCFFYKYPAIILKLVKIFTIIFIIFLSNTYSSAGEFKVSWVYDGDTFKAVGHDIEITVRFLAIDAPEVSYRKGAPGQPYGEQSKKMLMDLILNRNVEIKGYGLDQQNRVLAVVYSRGLNIGVQMIRKGMAEIYRGGLPEILDLKDYRRAEFQAKSSGLGMWNQGNAYISPREWRERYYGR